LKTEKEKGKQTEGRRSRAAAACWWRRWHLPERKGEERCCPPFARTEGGEVGGREGEALKERETAGGSQGGGSGSQGEEHGSQEEEEEGTGLFE
jgi:hypothetical protein